MAALLALLLVSCGEKKIDSGWETCLIGIVTDSTYAVLEQSWAQYEDQHVQIAGTPMDRIEYGNLRLTLKSAFSQGELGQITISWKSECWGDFIADSAFLLENTSLNNRKLYTLQVGEDKPKELNLSQNQAIKIRYYSRNFVQKYKGGLFFATDSGQFFYDGVLSGIEDSIPEWTRECSGIVWKRDRFLCVSVDPSKSHILIKNMEREILDSTFFSMASSVELNGQYVVVSSDIKDKTVFGWASDSTLNKEPLFFLNMDSEDYITPYTFVEE